jgi:hypothetical protein
MARLGYAGGEGAQRQPCEELAAFGEAPHRMKITDGSGSAVVQQLIDRWVASLG